MAREVKKRKLVLGIVLSGFGFASFAVWAFGIYEYFAWLDILASEDTTHSGLEILFLLLGLSAAIMYFGYRLIRENWNSSGLGPPPNAMPAGSGRRDD